MYLYALDLLQLFKVLLTYNLSDIYSVFYKLISRVYFLLFGCKAERAISSLIY